MTSIHSPIEDAITRYYLFFAQMENLKVTLQRLPVNNVEKANCVRQLQNVEGESGRNGETIFFFWCRISRQLAAVTLSAVE